MDVDQANLLMDITNINEKVYQRIKQNIIKFIYPPGHNLNINEVKDLLGVSPTPIKDALFKLAGEGLVVIYPRKGTYVRDITDEDFREIIQTRLILETAAVSAIAGNINKEQLQTLDDLFRKSISLKVHRDNIDDYKAFMESDSQFHLSFFLFLGNQRLTEMYKNLNGHMQIVRYRLWSHTRGKNSWTDQDHRKILAALKRHDSPGAVKAVENHLVRLEAACLATGEAGLKLSPR